MDKEWQHLINAIYSLNGFSWTDAVSILSLIASWITIAFLLREKLALENMFIRDRPNTDLPGLWNQRGVGEH